MVDQKFFQGINEAQYPEAVVLEAGSEILFQVLRKVDEAGDHLYFFRFFVDVVVLKGYFNKQGVEHVEVDLAAILQAGS